MQKLFAAVVVVLAACGGGGGSLSIEDYPAARRDAFCEYAVGCGAIADVEACRTTTIGQPLHLSASLLAAVDAGKVKFRGGDAQACVDALADRSCDVTSASNRQLPAVCDTIFVGTQGEGASCVSDDECVSQLCEVPACDDACCTGACIGGSVPGLAKAGESCETARCDDTAFCDETKLCVARKGAGGGCIIADNCRFGLDCGPDNSCVALPALGEPCDGACRDEGTTCSQTSRTCVAVAVEGEVCAMSSDCSLFYVCDATKHCSPGIALDAPCIVGQRCADAGAFCDAPEGESMGSCVLPKPVGEPCTGDTGCASFSCDRVTQRCVVEPVCL